MDVNQVGRRAVTAVVPMLGHGSRWLVLLLARGAGHVVRRPLPVAVVVFVALVWSRIDSASLSHAAWRLVMFGVPVLVLAGLWRWRWPRSFEVCVLRPWRSWLRKREFKGRWATVMMANKLTVKLGDVMHVPRLRAVAATPFGDRVLVSMLSGQTIGDYDSSAEALAHSFGARTCRARSVRPGVIALEFVRVDPLGKALTALPIREPADLEALALGVREDGSPWLVRMLGTHLLVAGTSGAGKGSVFWSLLRALAPAIRDGLVQVWAFDPKGGMELTFGQRLFARFAYESAEEMAAMLEDAVDTMRARTASLRGKTRQHKPSKDEPLVIVLVDELAALTAYGDDPKIVKRINTALALLLSQGRAPGVLVVAAVQDPRKEVIGNRDLFSLRIALRLLGPEDTDMVLGAGARAAGARCESISPKMQGTAFVRIEGQREPERVRAAYVSDDDIAAMVEKYAPLAPPVVLDKVERPVPEEKPARPSRARKNAEDTAA